MTKKKQELPRTIKVALNGRLYAMNISEWEMFIKKKNGVEYAIVLEKVVESDLDYLKDMGILK
ncbi:hypothetical protein [Caldisericum sp.]|uniref:hypothetical protein n=1 Tax=Caldisericum sp. TaxID=2499687 RepID=UPI003D0CBEC9